MHSRIREVRKMAGLTQAEFGERLGVSRDVIGNIEYNRLKNPEQKEPIIKLICSTFGVDELWLRTGAGEPFRKKGEAEELTELFAELLSGDRRSFRTAFITELLRLKPEAAEWTTLEAFFSKLTKDTDS